MDTRHGKNPSEHGRNSHLEELGKLPEYKIAREDPDVRGWLVHSSDSQPIGRVEELIVDTQAEKVRYLIVDVDKAYAADSKDHYMLVPIGAARVEENGNSVRLNHINSRNSTNYPVYRGDSISREYENSIRRFYESGGTAPQGSEIIRDVHTGKSYYSSETEKQRPTTGTRSSDIHRSTTDSHQGPSAEVGSGSRIPKAEQPVRDIEERRTPEGRTPDSHHMDDKTQATSNTVRSDWETTGRNIAGKRPFGTSNLSDGNETLNRRRSTGIPDNRTANLPQKDLTDLPTSGSRVESQSDKELPGNRDVPHKSSEITDKYGQPLHHEERKSVYGGESDAEFKSTSNLRSSSSLGERGKEATSYGNEKRMKADSPQDRRPAPSPNEVLKDDTYYEDPNYDESRFYGTRRRREL